MIKGTNLSILVVMNKRLVLKRYNFKMFFRNLSLKIWLNSINQIKKTLNFMKFQKFNLLIMTNINHIYELNNLYFTNYRNFYIIFLNKIKIILDRSRIIFKNILSKYFVYKYSLLKIFIFKNIIDHSFTRLILCMININNDL